MKLGLISASYFIMGWVKFWRNILIFLCRCIFTRYLFSIKLHNKRLVTFSISFFCKDDLKELDVQRLSKIRSNHKLLFYDILWCLMLYGSKISFQNNLYINIIFKIRPKFFTTYIQFIRIGLLRNTDTTCVMSLGLNLT